MQYLSQIPVFEDVLDLEYALLDRSVVSVSNLRQELALAEKVDGGARLRLSTRPSIVVVDTWDPSYRDQAVALSQSYLNDDGMLVNNVRVDDLGFLLVVVMEVTL